MEVCKNSLTMFGPESDIQRFKQELAQNGEAFSLNAVIPEPQELIEISKKGILNPQTVQRFGAMNINSWRFKNWGCYKNSFNSKIMDERGMRTNIIREALEDSITSGRLTNDDSIKMAKEVVDTSNYGMSIYFETDESPTEAMKTISAKYPSILFHFGYDSESEGVCGWVGLRAGEIQGHTHYDDCLKQIKVNVSPFDND